MVAAQKSGDKKGRLEEGESLKICGTNHQEMMGHSFKFFLHTSSEKNAENLHMNLCLLERGNITRYVKVSYGCQKQ